MKYADLKSNSQVLSIKKQKNMPDVFAKGRSLETLLYLSKIDHETWRAVNHSGDMTQNTWNSAYMSGTWILFRLCKKKEKEKGRENE